MKDVLKNFDVKNKNVMETKKNIIEPKVMMN